MNEIKQKVKETMLFRMLNPVVLLPLLLLMVATNAEYIGCYDQDVFDDEDRAFRDRDGTTVERCESACNTGEWSYYGLEEGVKCYCGNDMLQEYSDQGNNACDHACAGDSSSVCGGDNLYSVYSYNGSGPPGGPPPAPAPGPAPGPAPNPAPNPAPAPAPPSGSQTLKYEWQLDQASNFCEVFPNNKCYSNPTLERTSFADGGVVVSFGDGDYLTADGVSNYGWGGPIPQSDRMILEYDLRFHPGYDLNSMGKLPGLFGGPDVSDNNERCAFKDNAEMGIGAGIRPMWRSDGSSGATGIGEMYTYIHVSDTNTNAAVDSGLCWDGECDGDNWSIGRGQVHFRTHASAFQHLRLEVQLNNAGSNNGYMKLTVDDETIYIEGLNLRPFGSSSWKMQGVLFHTFFGGGDTKADSNSKVTFKNLKVYI